MQPVDYAHLANRREDLAHRRPPYSPLQAFFVRRLEHLLAMRQQYIGRLSADDWRVKLIDRGLYSTYCDCIDLGLVHDARLLVDRFR